MKKAFLFLAAAGCFHITMAQTPVTVSTGGGNAEQIWYSLLNGEVGAAPLSEWDLAFELTGLTAGVRVNTAKGLVAYETTVAPAEWATLTVPDPEAWTRVDNDPERWDMGALNHGNDMDLPEGLNVGWGVYNPINHQMLGNKVYAIEFQDETWKKLRINSVINGVFSFTYANLDGTAEVDAAVNKTAFAGKNFAYWSMTTDASMDREPASSSWDLLFTKYTDFVPTPYNVAGVLQNRLVTALQVNGVPTDDAAWTTAPFSSQINTLGADWKRYDFEAVSYVIASDTTYFVKDRPGNIWKIIFTGYGGSANGNMSFTKELVSAVGIREETAAATVLAYPNPASAGQVQLVLDLPDGKGLLHVYNGAGTQVLAKDLAGLQGLTRSTIDVSGLAAGVYIMRIESAKGIATGKLVIK
ncbi:MAG TPA: T9SS type A sorting domain-containing protein [Flavobacteriales bacterium]|nr:T9SS type A sorting domain-containing protein [Flavobacteriales bacterium]